jgi:hypothetical protein
MQYNAIQYVPGIIAIMSAATVAPLADPEVTQVKQKMRKVAKAPNPTGT